MAVVELLKLVSLEFETDKDTQDLKVVEGGDVKSVSRIKRVFSIDYSMKKAFGLLGIYIGIVNAQAPAIFLEIVKIMIGG